MKLLIFCKQKYTTDITVIQMIYYICIQKYWLNALLPNKSDLFVFPTLSFGICTCRHTGHTWDQPAWEVTATSRPLLALLSQKTKRSKERFPRLCFSSLLRAHSGPGLSVFFGSFPVNLGSQTVILVQPEKHRALQ